MSEVRYPLKGIPKEQAEHYMRVSSMKTPIEDFIEMINASVEVVISFKNNGDHFSVKTTAKIVDNVCYTIEELFEKPFHQEQFEKFPKKHISALFMKILGNKYGIK